MLRRAVLVLSLVGAALAAVPGTATSGHLSDRDGVVSGARSTATGASYTFSAMSAGRPVRWDPCTPIHWKYRTSGQVVGGFTQTVRAIARISRVTGTTWVYDGAVTTAPTTAWLPKTATARPPVLIGWTNAAHSDLLAGQPAGVLGVTRTMWFSTTSGGTTTSAIRGAVVALNSSAHLPLSGAQSWYTVLLHELSHGMGLGHATSSKQLMFPLLQPGLTDLQTGDLAGLAKLGRTEGCIRF